ncbi:hypothetical protein NQ315_005828 [Exocentrus adspersus]|uniref:Stimulator of interferon genes protein n=1 Tax=Exocentrus adspersus TaxID=1586481 RepID=A0AAV8VSA7_9CUCU|nr:hypothetical protein NQ315_005828 [Exocentrus adspersus]
MTPIQDDQEKINLKAVCVLQRGRQYYYPASIPKERGALSTRSCLCVSFVLFLMDLLTSEKKISTVIALYVLGILFSIALQILYRIFLVLEETNHVTSRYEGSYKILLKNAFSFTVNVWIVLVGAVIYAVYYFCTNNISELQISLRDILYLVPSIYLSILILEVETSPLNDSLWIAKDNGLDYGSGMAYSFFHGYLKLVLPKTGIEDKNLKELMEDYEAQHKIQFSVYKLFILIPKSLYCPISLKNESSPSVDESDSLSGKIKTIAGVRNRVYKNAVYKISPGKGKDKIYVSAEYATPLRTFLEVVNHTGNHTDYYNKHKNDIILQFYLTLKNVLEKTGLSEFCELIYYEDYPHNNYIHPIPYYDVGKIILTRLKELKKNPHQKTE